MKHLRKEYVMHSLFESDVHKNPFTQFNHWFEEAVENNILEPNAMTLATMNACRPSARIVLLKEVDSKGFVFYSNYNSKKGKDLKQYPQAALLFFWDKLERQIRIEGKVVKITKSIAEKYFDSRPKNSRIAALVSHQSEVIPNRELLENRMKKLQQNYADTEQIPMPSYWGGYRLVPDYFEFWQGRSSRLHDRLIYEKNDKAWTIKRLSP